MSFLLQENFEGAGYENSWAETGSGTRDEDYTSSPAPLEGSQSLRLAFASQSGAVVWTLAADEGTLELYFLVHFASLPIAGKLWVRLRDSGAARIASVEMGASNKPNGRHGSTSTGATATAIATGTTYHVWLRYVKGTGANGACSLAWSTDGVRPTSGNQFASTSSGTGTADVHDLVFGTENVSTWEAVFDKIRLSVGTIGDNGADGSATNGTATPAGVSTTSSLGTATGTGGGTGIPSGQGGTTSLGTTTSSGTASTAATGQSTTSALGTAPGSGAGTTSATGNACTSGLGDPVGSGAGNHSCNGFEITSALGTVIATGDPVVEPPSAPAPDGGGWADYIEAFSRRAFAYPRGVSARARLGRVHATATGTAAPRGHAFRLSAPRPEHVDRLSSQLSARGSARTTVRPLPIARLTITPPRLSVSVSATPIRPLRPITLTDEELTALVLLID